MTACRNTCHVSQCCWGDRIDRLAMSRSLCYTWAPVATSEVVMSGSICYTWTPVVTPDLAMARSICYTCVPVTTLGWQCQEVYTIPWAPAATPEVEMSRSICYTCAPVATPEVDCGHIILQITLTNQFVVICVGRDTIFCIVFCILQLSVNFRRNIVLIFTRN